VDPLAPAKLYAGLVTSGLYRSTDGGAHWSPVESVAASEGINSVWVGDIGLSAGVSTVAIATKGDGPLVSTDGANTFTTFSDTSASIAAGGGPVPKYQGLDPKCPLGLTLVLQGSTRKDGDTIFIWSCETPNTPGETDLAFGFLWTKQHPGQPNVAPALVGTIIPWPVLQGGASEVAACAFATAIVFNPADDASYYAGSGCGVLKGTLDGKQLIKISTGLPEDMLVKALATTATGSDVYAGAQSGGVWRYTPSGAPATPVPVVEFYNAFLDHYFITWVPDEIAKLDAGTVIKGWARTGQTFRTYTTVEAGTSPVCRFYIPPGLGDSHFFGRGTVECNSTAAKNPTFVNEDPDFMNMFLPATGVCPGNTTQVYRVFSNRPDANHRYMTDKAIRASMVAKGWLAEGDGADLVVMCAP
jgi:hypothetical protein